LQNTVHFFYKNNFIRTRGSFNKLRTIPASAEEQSLKFSIKIVNKTAESAAQFAKCILLHTYSCTTAAHSGASTNKNFI